MYTIYVAVDIDHHYGPGKLSFAQSNTNIPSRSNAQTDTSHGML